MTILNTRTSLLALSLAVVACDTEEPRFGAGDVDNRCATCGGIKLNTNKIGAHIFSEIDVTGEKWDGIVLDHVDLKRTPHLDKVWVEAGQILGMKNNYQYGGADFVNSIWYLKVEMDPGVWIDAKMLITKAMHDPLYGWKYTFSHQYLGGPKEWMPNCDDDQSLANGEQFDAIVTGDITVDPEKATISHRPSTMYLGCVSGGVGKAGLWGYTRHQVGSDESFTAGVRMVRSDFCGDGSSFTIPGQQLTTTDIFGISSLTPFYKLEAHWDAEGALCVYQPRLASDWPDATSVLKECELHGVPRIPKECDSQDDLNSQPNSLYMSANPN